MSKDIGDVIREMSEEEIARIRNGYEDPMFQKGDEIEYEDDDYCVVDYSQSNGNHYYLVRPLDEPGVVWRYPQDITDMVAEEVGDR